MSRRASPRADVLALTGAAFCLRFYRLGFHSLWLDEVVTVRDAAHSFREIPSVIASYPPLWAYITRIFYLLFGPNDFWLRVPAVLFGTITVPIIWWAAKRFYGDRAAFWAGLLMAVSVFDVLYSQEVRMYTLVALLALVSMVFWTRAFETREKKYWLLYAGITLVGLYTHNWFPFLVFAQSVWFAVMNFRQGSMDRKGMAAYGGIAALYSPWLFVLKKQLALPVYGHLHAPNLSAIRETFYAFAGIRVPSGDFWVGVGVDARNPLLFVSLGFLLWGLFSRGETRSRAIRTFMVGCFIPVATAFLISVFIKPIYLPGRYPILGLPAYVLTVSRGFQEMPARFRRGAAVLGGAWVVLCLYTLSRYYWFYEKSPWKETCEWISSHSPAGEPVNLDLRASYASYFAEYYLAARHLNEEASRDLLKNVPVYTVVEENQLQDPIVFPPWRITDSARFGRLTVYKTQKI
jgi:4-amino-4-deoxy-L-arabinose transferase-like glycosyltransferase